MAQPELWRWSVEQYHEMLRTGIVSSGDPVELLEGLLTKKMSKNPPHRIATRLLYRSLEAVTPAGWYVDQQEPITLAMSEPEPDVMVVRGETTAYADRHPGASDVALVAGIADASLAHDRTVKKRIYAEAGIPQYWLLDLVSRRLEVYSDPRDGVYRLAKQFAFGEAAPVVLDGVERGTIAVTSLLPPE